jgi:ELWxxDGT repeat protein
MARRGDHAGGDAMMARVLISLLAALCTLAASATPIQLVKDINRTVNLPRISNAKPAPLGAGWILPLCTGPNPDCNPWFTDGTEAGTRMVKSISPPGSHQSPREFIAMGGYVYFFADEYYATSGTHLWRTDGTENGTVEVVFFPFGGAPDSMVATGSTLVFYAKSRTEVWRSDGTAAGTFKLANATSGYYSAPSLAQAGGLVYFSASGPTTGTELWKTDGTAAGTVMVKDINPGPSGSTFSGLAAIGTKVFFWASDATATKLWVSDGTDAGTQPLYQSPGGWPTPIVDLNGKAVFIETLYTGGTALWQSNGTAAGTSSIALSGYASSAIAVAGSLVYFGVDTAVSGFELWRSDGTPTGTFMAKDIAPGPSGAGVYNLLAVGNVLYFATEDSLWRSEGTEATTVLVPTDIRLYPWAALGDRVLLADESGGGIARISDGTAAGTSVLPIASGQPTNGADCGGPSARAVLGSMVLFYANDGLHGCELWKSDGTADGTQLVKDINAGVQPSIIDRYPHPSLVLSGGSVYFQALDNESWGLWKSDGTTAGTVLVKRLPGGQLENLTAVGATVFFTNGYPWELWKTDGTLGGTVVVKQLPAIHAIASFTAVGGSLFFTATNHLTAVSALWKSDGTASGTVELAQFTQPPGPLAALGNVLLFGASDAAHGYELWRSDGTASGTTAVLDLNSGGFSGLSAFLGVVGNSLVFSGNQTFFDTGLWATDGTAGGTRRLGSLGTFGGNQAIRVAGTLYFVADYFSLYRTDATAAGTALVTRLDSWAYGIAELTAGPGTVFFLAADGTAGRELWLSSGSSGGTAMVEDFNPGLANLPVPVAGLNALSLPGGLFFFTSTPAGGFEPHFLPFDAVPDPVTFAAKNGVLTNGTATSDGVQVLGLNVPAAVTASGGEFCVSSGTTCACDFAPYAANGSVNYGQYLCVRHPTPGTANATTTTTLSIGGIAAAFSSTTGSTNPPTLQLAATAFQVVEGGPVIPVPVQRVGSAAEAVSVRWTTQDARGAAGFQFGTPGSPVQPSGILTWAAGDAAAKIITVGPGAMVPIIDDASVFVDATFSIVLSNPTGGAAVGTPSSAVITIADNESFIGFASGGGVTVYENRANVDLWVVRTGSLAGTSTVQWTTASGTAIAGSDFGGRGVPSGTLVFAPGETMKPISIGPVAASGAYIPIIDDALVEPSETFTVSLSTPGGALLTSQTLVTVTIISDESGIALERSAMSVGEGSGYVVLWVYRIGSGDGTSSVSYTTANGTALAGTHYTAVSGTIQWGPGDTTQRAIVVPIQDNSVVNAARTFEFRLTGATGAVLGTPATTVITLLDDDNTLQFSAPTATVTEGTPGLTLSVTRLGGAAGFASVLWQANDGTARAGSDYGYPGSTMLLWGSLSWNAGDSTAKSLTIPIINDNVAEGAKTFTVSLYSPSGAALGAMPTVNVTLNDDDSGVMFSAPSYSVGEAAGSVTLTVNRVGLTNSGASVKWAAANGSATYAQDFGGGRGTSLPTGTLTWAVGDTTPRTITIPIINDTIADGSDETFTVALSAPSTGMVLSTPSTATVTIVDDEIAPETEISFNTTKLVVTEVATGAASLALTRTALPGHNCNRDVTVNYGMVAGTALAASDFTPNSGTVRWTPGDCTPKAFLSVPVLNDGVIEPPETFTIQLSSPSPGARLGVSQATVLILDDDELFPPANFLMGGPWRTTVASNSAWRVSYDPSPFEGFRSLRSGMLDDNEASQIELAGGFAAGTVSFRLRVSSEEGFDFLRFYVDGVRVGEWSGTSNTSWQTFTTPLTAGYHELRWSYEKDGSASMGQDAAWIDGLTHPAVSAPF